MTTTVDYEFRSDFVRKLMADAEERVGARSKAQGEASAVLTVLDARGVAVPIDVRDRILACTDLAQLDTWLRRSGTAATIDDVIRE